jgi:hypothetical protein
MFNYPGSLAYAKAHAAHLTRAEQRCLNRACRKWFEIPLTALRDTLTYEKAHPGAIGIPMVPCTCTHCGTSSFILIPGKYDAIDASKPGHQRYTFSTSPSASRAP